MLGKIKLILSTIKYLKPRQLKYQLFYRLKKVKNLKYYQVQFDFAKINALRFEGKVWVSKSYLGDNCFSFLNIEFCFGNKINWNEQRFGKLWNYNLQYCNYLLQDDIATAQKVDLLRELYGALLSGNLALEPYPASLRCINVIRLISSGIQLDNDLLTCLHAELSFLSQRLEFHILGNHLLENAFAMAMGGAFFDEELWFDRGVELIISEIEEQTLSDGAHFELSPMYHQIILFRVLEFYDWYSKYKKKSDEKLKFLSKKAALMLNWLSKMTFENGDIPLFNDSANGIAYSSCWLFNYGVSLNLPKLDTPLKESGYRAVNYGIYECRIDFAQIGASYQPGHSHADALSFILYVNKRPLFVEQGTSTYQIGERRSLERSTQAHNTVELNHTNQSEVWGGFRTAQRAYVDVIKDEKNIYKAKHNGYERDFKVTHTRTFTFSENSVEIHDTLSKKSNGKCYFHLYPGTTIELLEENKYLINNNTKIAFGGANDIIVENYEFADSYNTYQTGERLVVFFDQKLYSTLLFNY